MIKPKLSHQPRASSEAGYTILEGIMAIVVVTVLLVAISPMIGFAAAVRMQAKRTQLASQAARSYVSFAKSEPTDEDGNVTGENAPGTEIYKTEGSEVTDLADVAAPDAGNLTCEQGNLFPAVDDAESGYCSNQKLLYCVNFDETAGCQDDSPVDMIVQPIGRFRTDPNTGDVLYDRGYDLAVRVYQASSFGKGIELRGMKDDGRTETQSYIGNRELPLVQISTSVPPKTGNQYSTFCEDLGCD
jgi:type II secretory pathway pseudopilin PulG